MEIIKNGAIWVGEQITDFLIEWEVSLPPLVMQDNIRYAYNQNSKKERMSDCTLFGPFGALSDLKNIRFRDEDIEEIRTLAKTRWKKDNKGWYTQLWVKVVCDWWNSKNSDKVLYFRIDLLSDNFTDLISKNYTIISTFKGNSKYTKDKNDNGIINWTSFWTSTRWHCTDLFFNEWIYVKDSYDWVSKTNIYKLENLKGLVDNNVFYSVGYVILPEESVKLSKEEIKKLTEFKNLIQWNIESNSKQRHLTNSEQYKDWLHEANNVYRSKIDDINKELKNI